MSAPNQAERKKCWIDRDEYWACLDKHDGDKNKCQELRKAFESSCSPTWVKYFDRRRDYLRFKEKMEKEGYEPIDNNKKKV